MNNPKKWIAGGLAAVFVAVAGVTAVSLTPAFNGTQPESVWQNEAKLAVEKSLPPFANVEYVSTAQANSAGSYDSKILTFRITGPFGRISKKAEVRCSQEKTNLGLRGGKINCEKPVISSWHFQREMTQ